MTSAEIEAGITYADLDINVDRCRGPECKTFCPKCHDSRQDKSDKSLSVNLERGEWNCHYSKCGWHSGLGIEGRERMRVNGQRPTGHHNGVTVAKPSTPLNGSPVSRSSSPAQSADPSAPRELPPELHSWASEEFLAPRGIPGHIAEQFSVRSSEYADKKTGEIKRCIHFPYYVDGKHVNTKHRTMPKQFSQERGTLRSLYNIDNCQGAEAIVIAEGELDVIACAVAGWESAVSAPDGAGTGGRTFSAFDEPFGSRILEAARWLIVATDADEPGRAYCDALVSRFGPSRCRVVEWPEGVKDANEMLVQFGPTALADLLQRAQPSPLPGLRPLSAHRESLHRRYESGFSPGVSTGWPDFDYKWRPVEGEVVFLSGYPGDGKTSWVNHLLTNIAYVNDWHIAIFSPEQGIEGEILGKLCSIVADAPYLPNFETRLSLESLDRAVDWVGEHFYEIHADLEDDQGFASLTIPQVLGIVEPGVVGNNIKMLVIDPWNELESARPRHMSVEEYISTSLSTIRGWAKRNRCVVMIVIHPRKPESIKAMEKGPHPYDAAGAAHWNNKADVFLTVQRVREGESAGNTIVKVHKHRREGITGETGAVEFQFKRETGRFYCLGTIVPDQYGSFPYTDLPLDIMFPNDQEVAAINQMDFDSVPF